MNINKAKQARELLAEKESLEKAINYTLSEFDITVKIDSRHPNRVWLDSYLKLFIKDELKVLLEARLLKIEKQLRRL